MVAPERETPGKMASACATPMRPASRKVMVPSGRPGSTCDCSSVSSAVDVPTATATRRRRSRSAKTSSPAVSNRNPEIARGLAKAASKVSSKSKPAAAAGTDPSARKPTTRQARCCSPSSVTPMPSDRVTR
jgi:hypothetical protein